MSSFTKTEQGIRGQEQRISKDRQQRAKCLGNPLWLKYTKRCTREEQMVKDLEWHAKEFGFIL